MITSATVIICLVLAAVFYIAVHSGLVIGLNKCRPGMNTSTPLVSIIVAARNEEQTIRQLLECLLNQTYTNYEIVIANDRSTDGTGQIIEALKKGNSNIVCVNVESIPDDMPAKKNALRAAISASKGDILCFTDADCFPPSAWLQKMIGSFEPEVGLVAGYSPYIIPAENHSFAERIFFDFIGYEELRAAGWAAGSIGLNYGWLCTGRNLAYRRRIYEELGGFDKIKKSVSGDDDLFLQMARKYTKWKIVFNLSKEISIPTLPPPSFRTFIEQRKRHFSAARFFPFHMKMFFSLYHLSNLMLFSAPVFYLTGILSFSVSVIFISVKIMSDFMLFNKNADVFNGRRFYTSFFIMEALYVPYNILIGLMGLFRKFEWKKA